jgi:hypothetical protein
MYGMLTTIKKGASKEEIQALFERHANESKISKGSMHINFVEQ